MSNLLIIALRADDDTVEPRVRATLAAARAAQGETDSIPSVYAKPVDELVASDLDRLAGFMGWEGVRALNIGDVVDSA